jgi:type II secretory pathway pseudopilin PulG
MWSLLKTFGGSALSWLTGNLTLVLIILALAGTLGGVWWGWSHGSASARNEMQAEYQKNLADATREAMTKQQAAQVFANGLAADLIAAKRNIETQRTSLRGRIVYVTREIPADCGLPPDAVRLWNEARRLSAPGLSQAGAPGRADGPAASTSSAGSGQGNATVADAIADHVDYVSWCEGVVAQRDRLQDLIRGWAQ